MEILRFFLGFLRYFRDIWDCLLRFLKLFSNLFQDFKISLEVFKILRLFWRFLICLRCFFKILRFWLRFLRFLWRFQGFFEILFLEIVRKFYQIFSSYLTRTSLWTPPIESENFKTLLFFLIVTVLWGQNLREKKIRKIRQSYPDLLALGDDYLRFLKLGFEIFI